MFSNKFVYALSLSVMAGGLVGCGAEDNSIFRTPGSTTGVGVVTDAKQRVVIHKYLPERGSDKKKVVCAEPSPDVAQALSTALNLSAQASLAGVKGVDDVSVGAQLGYSMSESIIQLGERLAVIQLLRDKMYRACEAYANGAIPSASYTLILARLDKTMTTLLSAEMTSGAFGRPLAGIGGAANAVSVNPKALEDVNQKIAEALKTNNAEQISKAYDEKLDLILRGVASFTSGRLTPNTGLLQSATAVGGIAEIHRAYLNDSGVEPLIDACLTVMATEAALGGDIVKVHRLREKIEQNKTHLEDVQKRFNALHKILIWYEKGFDDQEHVSLDKIKNNLMQSKQEINIDDCRGDYACILEKIRKIDNNKIKSDVNMTQRLEQKLIADIAKFKEKMRGINPAFLEVCNANLLMNDRNGHSFIKDLIQAKTTYHNHALGLAKVNAVSATMTACYEAAGRISNEENKEVVLRTCTEATKDAMTVIKEVTVDK